MWWLHDTLPAATFTVFFLAWLVRFARPSAQSFLPALYFIAGLAYAQCWALIQVAANLTEPTQINATIRVDSLPRITSQKTSFIGTDIGHNKTYLLSQYATPGMQPSYFQAGDVYTMTLSIKPPHGSANGVGFDRERWLFRHQISGLGSIQSHQFMGSSQRPSAHINRWRSHISERLNQLFSHADVNALVHALTLGDKSHFDQRTFETLQATGTAHLIAISGLHIGMVAWLGWILGAGVFHLRPQQWLPKPVIQTLVGLLLAAFYASLAGWSVSTQRAMIMLLVYGLMLLFRSHVRAWDVWAVSLMWVLLIDPFNALDAGFWLSFTAVAILIFAFNFQTNKSPRWLTFFKAQWVLGIGMLPLNGLVFSRYNLIAPWVNLLAIPLMTFFLVPLLLLLLVVMSMVPSTPGLLVELVAWISSSFLTMLHGLAQWDFAELSLNINHSWQLIVLVMAAVLLTMPTAMPHRYLGLVLIGLVLLVPTKPLPANHFRADVLDVGQGLSVLISTRNHHLLYDVGAAFDSGFNQANAVVLPYLAKRHIKTLDGLVLSHQDNDHAGAAPQLLKAMEVHQVWDTLGEQSLCQAGHSWQWDGVTFAFLSPPNVTPYLKNNSSCVLKVTNHNHSLLLTGDIEKPVEYRLSQLPPEWLQADTLLVPHHGSKTSSTQAFIAAVNPQTAINSSGQFNPFGHPKREIKNRYLAMGIQFIDTQSSGQISLSTYPELHFSEFRLQHPKIWRKKKPE